MRAKNNLVIEIAGLPGSYKTTLANAIVARFSEVKRIGAMPLCPRLFYFLWYCFAHPIKLTFWKLMLYKEGPLRLFRYKIHLWWTATARFQKARQVHGPALLDEGTVQRVLSVLEHNVSETEMSRILSYTPLPDIILILSGGTFGRFFDADKKDKSPRANLGTEYLSGWKETIEHNHAVLTTVLARQYPEKLMTCDASTGTDAVLGQLAARISDRP